MAAPMAQFDEDWQDFNEFKAASDDTLDRVNCNLGEPGPEENFCPDLESPECGQIRSYISVEDLVQNFEKKLSACFSNYSTRTEEFEAVQSFTEERLLQEDEIWNALTENFGNVMPVDWKTSHTRSLHLPSLNLHQQPQGDGVNLDLSDDEELREQMDLHSIIVSCINEEPLFTAEQVISEIEQMMMMQESPEEEDEDSAVSQSDLSLVSQELQTLSHSTSTSSYEERLRGLSVSDLEVQLEEVEKKIQAFSEELIDQLALRDELEFEKEVKNSFISLLIDVQNRQKELLKRRKKGKNSTGGMQRGERMYAPGTYLTTVIPYEKRSGAPSVEDLQILTKILHAMRDDSDKVPSLLTDYILKVLCPT